MREDCLYEGGAYVRGSLYEGEAYTRGTPIECFKVDNKTQFLFLSILPHKLQ